MLALGGPAAATGEPFSVQAYIQPEQGITEAEPFQLLIQIEGATSPRVSPPRLGELTNLQVLGGPNTSTRMSWINGRSTATITLVYSLLAKQPGPAEIPSIDVQVGVVGSTGALVESKTYRTAPIRFNVGRGSSTGPPAAQRPRPQSGTREQADVYIESALGAEEVWVGQPVTLSLLLYTTGQQISNLALADQPGLSEFWIEDADVDPEAEAYRSTLGARQYLTFPVLRKTLVPQTAGEFVIDPYVIQMQVRSRGGVDPFDLFSFGRTETVVRKSQPRRLRVKELPAVGRPGDFSGAVGSFSMRVSLDREEARVNDAVALKATVEGEGFLKLAKAPVLEPPPDLKVLEPKVSESFRSTGGRMVSKKTWEWIVVPLAQGELRLPELRFDFFDPVAGQYRAAARPIPQLIVHRGDTADDAPTARGEIQLQRREIAFIKPLRGPLHEDVPRAHQRAVFLTLLLLPVAWVPMLILLGRHRARLQGDRGLARSRKARARARRRLKSVKRHLQQVDSSVFHEEVARALVDYVADRFDRSPAGLTYELAEELLASQGVEPVLRRRYRTCLESCDFARFVPAAGKVERRAELLEEAGGLVESLERAW